MRGEQVRKRRGGRDVSGYGRSASDLGVLKGGMRECRVRTWIFRTGSGIRTGKSRMDNFKRNVETPGNRWKGLRERKGGGGGWR